MKNRNYVVYLFVFLIIVDFSCVSSFAIAPNGQDKNGTALIPHMRLLSRSDVQRSVSPLQKEFLKIAKEQSVDVVINNELGTPRKVCAQDLLSVTGLSAISSKVSIRDYKNMMPSESKAKAVLENISGLFGIKNVTTEFQLANIPDVYDPLGYRHIKLQQYHKGIPVIGGMLIVHFDKEGRAYEVNGQYVADINVEVVPKISEEKAVEKALEWLSLSDDRIPLVQPEVELIILALNSFPALTYQIVITLGFDALWKIYVSAESGAVLLAYNDVKFEVPPPSSGGSPVNLTGSILEREGGATNVVLEGWLQNNIYYLFSTNLHYVIYNSSTSSIYVDYNTYAHRTNSPDWGDSDRVEFSAARNFSIIQRYFSNVMNYKSYDNSNGLAFVKVHYGNYYDNAFWSPYVKQFFFGDGGSLFDSLVVLDVAAHEFAHALTEYSASLMYLGESGALNESFSDIFATIVEFYGQPNGALFYPASYPGYADWLIGEDCTKPFWGACLRDMRNPSSTNTAVYKTSGRRLPSRYLGSYWFIGQDDNGGVHYNNGPQCFMFYLLSEGGSGINDGIIYNVSGIGITNAAKIAFRTLTQYLTPYSIYYDAYEAWLSAARDLNPLWTNAVKSAWAAVGIPNNITNIDIGTALSQPSLVWQTEGSAYWFVQTYETHDGESAVQSGQLPQQGSSRSVLYTVVSSPAPSTLRFWWKVSSETNCDFLNFYIDTNLLDRISGEVDWQQKSYVISSGVHTLKWVYEKDPFVSDGFDCGWLDDVLYVTATSAPPPPIYVSATYGTYSDRIRVTWTGSVNASSYKVYRHYRNEFPGASFIAIVSHPTQFYDDFSATPAITWYYWIVATNIFGSSPLSEVTSGYRSLAPPSTFVVSAGTYFDRIRLVWSQVPGAISYQLWRSTAPYFSSATYLGEVGETYYDDVSVPPTTKYYYWIASKKWQATSERSSATYGWRRSLPSTTLGWGDYDGDAKMDAVLYKEVNGNWQALLSGNSYAFPPVALTFGGPGIKPIPNDYDGDCKTDPALYDVNTGVWIALLSQYNYASASLILGGSGWQAIPADYDGDGKADPAIFSAGNWKVLKSSSSYAVVAFSLGGIGTVPVPADYDGDGKVDPAVYYEIEIPGWGKQGKWQILLSASFYQLTIKNSSANNYLPVPADYDGDGKADIAVFDPQTGYLAYWQSSTASSVPIAFALGALGYYPIPADFDGDRKADVVLYNAVSGIWNVRLSSQNYSTYSALFGGAGYQAISPVRY